MLMLRTKKPLTLVLIRHAETIKNRESRHGSGNETLVASAEAQIRHHAEALHGLPNISIYCQPEERSQHTAAILATLLGLKPPVIVHGTHGVNMGIASGLSDRELALRHPIIALSYVYWRHIGGTLRLPHVEGVEPIKDFSKRDLRGLTWLLDHGSETTVFVGTTSGILMLNHLLIHDGHLRPDQYYFYELGFDKQATWHCSPDAAPYQ